MTVHELSREQLTQLKQDYIEQVNASQGEPTYMSELAEADSLISDDTIYENYGCYVFSEDDFM